jgi:hypothetical protein
MVQSRTKEIPFFPNYDPTIVATEEEANKLNEERSLLKKVFFPIDSRVVSQEKINKLLDPQYVKTEGNLSIWDAKENPDLKDLVALRDNESFQSQYKELVNLKALENRKNDENSLRNSTFDYLHNTLGLSPSTASNLTSVADFTPIYGDAVAVEDAVNAFKDGRIGEGLLHSTFAAAGLVPVAGDMLVNALKPLKKEALPRMFAYESSGKGLEKVEGVVQPTMSLRKTKSELYDFLKSKPELNKKVDVDENGDFTYDGNLVLDIKNMPEELASEVTDKLDNLWTKHGWTVSLNNKFMTEIDDSVAIFDTEKFLDLQRSSVRSHNKYGTINEDKIVPDGVSLEEILDHPELYKAYPELRKLKVRMMSDAYASKRPSVLANYTVSSNPEIQINPRLFKDLEYDGFKQSKSGQGWYKSIFPYKTNQQAAFDKPFDLQVLLHEVQHGVQHIEGFPHQRDSTVISYWNKQKGDLLTEVNSIQQKIESNLKVIENLSKELKDPVAYVKKYGTQGAIKDISTPGPARDEMIEELTSQWKSIIKKNEEELNLNYIKQLHLKFDIEELSGRTVQNDVYLNSFTEIESRNVEGRLWMDMSQRRKKSPWQTMTSKKGFNRRHWIREISRGKNGKIDYAKYHKLMNSFEEGIKKQIAKQPEVFKKPNGDIDVADMIHEYLFEHIEPLDLANVTSGLDIDNMFRRLVKDHILDNQLRPALKPMDKLKRGLSWFFKEGSITLDEIDNKMYNEFIEQWQTSLAKGEVKVGLKDVHYYDTTRYLKEGDDAVLKEVTPSSEVSTEPYPIAMEDGKSYGMIGHNRDFNELRKGEDLKLQIDNPKGDFAGEFYGYDYGKHYAKLSQDKVQKEYENGKLDEFIDLYRETGAKDMSDEDIIADYFDGSYFKTTGYIRDNKSVKFDPSELINFPGARGEHRTRHLSSDKTTLDLSTKEKLDRINKMYMDVAIKFDKPRTAFVKEFYEDLKNLVPEVGKKVENHDNKFKFGMSYTDEDDFFEKSIKLKNEHIEAITKEYSDSEILEILKNKNVGFVSKLDMLKRRIAKEGYNPDPIHIVVREDGKPFIYEGNHRLQEAFDSDRDFIEAKLTYIRGGEEANGPLHPEKIGIVPKGYFK